MKRKVGKSLYGRDVSGVLCLLDEILPAIPILKNSGFDSKKEI